MQVRDFVFLGLHQGITPRPDCSRMAKTAQDEQMARHISTRELTDVHIPVYSDQCWSLQYQPAVRCANINSAHEPCY